MLRQKKNYGNSIMQKYDLQKHPLKETKIPQDIITLYYSQVSTQAKISSFKNPHIKINLLLPRAQNPLSYYTLL
jgi:hypothetical protein